jgi:hypothetical protein
VQPAPQLSPPVLFFAPVPPAIVHGVVPLDAQIFVQHILELI